jgi:hypothetical protein
MFQMQFSCLSMNIILNKLMHFIQNNHLNKNKNDYFVSSLSKNDETLLTRTEVLKSLKTIIKSIKL